MVRHIGWTLLLAMLLAGCSPDYNWRQVQIANGAVAAFFPDRPSTEQRPLQYDGHELQFSLTSASVGEALFTIGYVALPEALGKDAHAREAFARAVVGSLYRNLGAEPPAALPPRGEAFVVQGSGPAEGMMLKAAVWLTDRAMVEGVVTAKSDEYPATYADEFLRGIVADR
jgi:hypothetical protein